MKSSFASFKLRPGFIRFYQAAALVVFNALVFFVVANLILFIADPLWHKVTGRSKFAIVRKYGVDLLQQSYPGLRRDEMLQLFEETWNHTLVYEPFTLFRDGAYRGRFVNVDARGFRAIKNQSAWPPSPTNFNIFVFGGSTTFGYGVADAETIPSFLQEKLPADVGGRRVRVFNFGRASYYSTQERILFEQLLASGQRPNLAIFIDGLNEFLYADDAPRFSEQLEQLFNGGLRDYRPLGILGELPVIQKLEKLQRSVSRLAAGARRSGKPVPTQSEEQLKVLANRACEHYLNNLRLVEAVAERFQVKAAFVWQPVPAYKYDLAYHPFREPAVGNHACSAIGYPLMALRVATHPPAVNFLWGADLQENRHEPLYVDAVHYSPKMCELLATEIALRIDERQLLK
jgi:hypothetical protein